MCGNDLATPNQMTSVNIERTCNDKEEVEINK